jgi:hypothetical protein
MAEVQYPYIERKKSESGQSGTATYDLPEGGFIPWIKVRAYSTPTASTNPALPLVEAITKIEIVDGATVIQSLTGPQVMGRKMFFMGRHLGMTSTDDNGVEGYEDFVLVLGGTFNGRTYAPDFSKFNNPQIKISWDYSATTSSRGMTCDADTSPAMKFTVQPKVVRGTGHGYVHGYVKSSEIYTFTQATSTETPVEIPRGEHLVGVMLHGGYAALDFTEDFEQIKLSFNNDAWVPVHLYEEEIIKTQDDWFGGEFSVSFWKDAISEKTYDLNMGYVTLCNMLPGTSFSLSFAGPLARQGVSVMNVWEASNSTAYTTYSQIQFNVRGYCPFGCWYMPMRAVLNGTADTIDTTKYNRIDLKMTSGSSASTSSTPAVVADYLITR